MTSLPVIIPNGFSPVVKNGDQVMIGQIIAQSTGKKDVIINIPKMLAIPLKKAKKVIKKNPGDAVALNDILALKKGLWGMKKEKLRSKVSGTIIRYERDTGNLVIRQSYTTLTEKLVSPVDGIVTLCDNERIVLGTDKNVLTAKKGTGGKGEGEVFILDTSFTQDADNPESANAVYFLDGRAVGRIVIGGNITREILIKSISIGAGGIIGTHIADEDFKYIAEKKLTTPVLEMESDIIQRLIEWKGKRIYIQGDLQVVILLHT